MRYIKLSEELQERIKTDREHNVRNPSACFDEQIIRRENRDRASIWRPAFVRDIEKILHSPYYNRYADKTQVFSFYKNDDITRRALHVQLVSRTGRNIGRILGLNEDLIEAIALGHDIGHTPFGHAGERFLNNIYQRETNRYFNHNVHSVRVLDQMFERNISLQVLDGILCHNGEFEMKEYRPCVMNSFEEYDEKVESCYVEQENIGHLIPSTLEGCVVRIADMIAYLGKDRQDAIRANILDSTNTFSENKMGINNAEIVNNMIVNIIENSYGKDYIMMDDEYFQALKQSKQENYAFIYKNDELNRKYNECIQPMFEQIYYKLLKDLKEDKKDSVIFKHHVDFVQEQMSYYNKEKKYRDTEENQIIVDYLASMTDDYFVDLYKHLFPKGKFNLELKYISYFNS